MSISRSDFQWLAKTRIREAKALLDKGLFDGAYYLAGYSVECALKARIVKTIKRSELPDKCFVDAIYTHNLANLLKLAGLRLECEQAMRDERFAENWKTAKDWKKQCAVRNLGPTVISGGWCLAPAASGVRARAPNSVRGSSTRYLRRELWSTPMVKEVLVDKQIEAGRALTEKLVKAGFPVTASFWLYDSEINGWRLTIALPAVDLVGPRKVYAKIDGIFRQNGDLSSALDPLDIHLAGPEDNLIRSFRKLRQRKLGGVRLSGTVVGGHYVEDAYVYKAA